MNIIFDKFSNNLFAVALITIFLTVTWYSVNDYAGFIANQQELAQRSVDNTAREIEVLIAGRKNSVRLFANRERDLLALLVKHPEDTEAQVLLQSRVNAYFPNRLAVTVANEKGDPLLKQGNKLVGKTCRRDIALFFADPESQLIHVHPSPGTSRLHFDILSNTSDVIQDKSVFFISFFLDDLFRILAHGQIVGHQLVKELTTTYIISDLQMPELNGIELARNVWSFMPDARIIFWSHYQDEIYLRSLSGFIPSETVYGYVLKDNTSEVLIKAVKQVFLEDQCWIDPKIRSVQARSQRSIDSITDAEYVVLIDIALGLTDNVIAQRRYLSRRGVQSRLKSLYQKLDIRGIINHDTAAEIMNPRSRAVAIALQRGLINTEELAREEQDLARWIKKESVRL